MNVRIFLADDHPIVRQGIRKMLETEPDLEVVAECGDGLEAIQLVEQIRPDVLIADLTMPGLNGLEVTRQSIQRLPELHVIILSMHQDDAYVQQAMRWGAEGYVLKNGNPTDLTEAIRIVMRGERFLSQKLNQRLIDTMAHTREDEPIIDRFEQLTEREREIFRLIIEGNTTIEIARLLTISPRTVEAHRANLMHKLNITNQVELFRYAIKRGLFSVT